MKLLTQAGTAGNDIITGTANSDLLSGGRDNDALNGGTGSDTYVYDRRILGSPVCKGRLSSAVLPCSSTAFFQDRRVSADLAGVRTSKRSEGCSTSCREQFVRRSEELIVNAFA